MHFFAGEGKSGKNENTTLIEFGGAGNEVFLSEIQICQELILKFLGHFLQTNEIGIYFHENSAKLLQSFCPVVRAGPNVIGKDLQILDSFSIHHRFIMREYFPVTVFLIVSKCKHLL